MVLPKSASVSPENIKAVCITVQFLPPFHLIIALGAKILVKYLVNNEKRANNWESGDHMEVTVSENHNTLSSWFIREGMLLEKIGNSLYSSPSLKLKALKYFSFKI